MRVVLAPSAYGERLGAVQVAAAMAQGWADVAPGDEVVRRPLSDGGPGFVEVVHALVGGDRSPLVVRGPAGEPVPATVLVVGEGAACTAYVEAAEAVGRHLVPTGRLDPGGSSSYGVGELVAAAVATGASRVVVGVGGTVTNDGGAGLLAALGAGPAERLAGGGLALADVTAEHLDGLAAVRARLAGVRLELAAATDVPLLGFHGTSATYAQGKGATAEQAQQLEAALGRYADVATRALGPGRPLLGRGPAASPGAGAGGGIGFGLLLLGATCRVGVSAVAEAGGLADAVAGSDLVVTGEAVFDWDALRRGVVPEVARHGLAAGVPVVVVAGEVLVGRREAMAVGVAGSYPVAARSQEAADALADVGAAVRDRTARVARTWSHS